MTGSFSFDQGSGWARLLAAVAAFIALSLLPSCDWFGRKTEDEPPEKSLPLLEMPDASTVAQRFKTLSREGVEWEHYLTAPGILWRGTRKFFSFAYLQAGAPVSSMRSALVLIPTALPAKGDPGIVFQEVPGTIFEIHSIRLGASLEAQLLFSVSVRREGESQVLSSIYWDVKKDKNFNDLRFIEVWKVVHAYDLLDARGSYRPPDFHYWDVDDDGLQEVVVTNAWKDKPPPWRYRWAVFHWDPQSRRMEPRRGLALFPFKEQHPEWLALALVEMLRLRSPEEELAAYFSSAPGCEMKRTLQMAAALEGVLSPPRTVSGNAGTARVQLDALPSSGKEGRKESVGRESQKDRLRLEVELRNEPIAFDRWRICRAQLYRVRENN